MQSILLGILASFFFAVTFILNRSMELSGGSWLWSASLRYIYMIPFLMAIVYFRKNLWQLFVIMRENLKAWFFWSFIGFGMFYLPLCFAAAYSPGWLTAGTWQITIVAGTLLTPLFFEFKEGIYSKKGIIPKKQLFFSCFILLGILLIQMENMNQLTIKEFLFGFIPILIAAFAYPLGNRKMMEITKGRLDAYQRVLGMTIASLPLWIIVSLLALSTVGPPSPMQNIQTLIVAISSGVIATVLFFKATDLVNRDMKKMAAVEATQSMEILFALAGEMIILSILFPSISAMIGIFIVMFGLVLHSLSSVEKKENTITAKEI
ncbi:multidrug resistance efflux transporter family protein [Pradoshia sp. D12]|uniref:DMT family transporter n=1 Tax=Bacillaceae TaxID=186817 RepID=UPI00112C7399|nr:MULTISPECIES: multidrug resistance efflux transporter family protein [Bacillaceae]QFK71178.1 multidrug resistance efflux transporter family protein [Pradoshia sp. D12]TPF72971.1 multidrug resistance efflux transporter family protein [Bacillus sp. D12]